MSDTVIKKQEELPRMKEVGEDDKPQGKADEETETEPPAPWKPLHK